ncbi:hypothetical protein Hanom_Chr02g00135071 [Helianthus anomalus]
MFSDFDSFSDFLSCATTFDSISCFVWVKLLSDKFPAKTMSRNGQKRWPYFQHLMVDMFNGTFFEERSTCIFTRNIPSDRHQQSLEALMWRVIKQLSLEDQDE